MIDDRFGRWGTEGMPADDAEMARRQRDISKTMHGVLADARHGISQSASMIPQRRQVEPEKKGDGWYDAAPLVRPRGGWAETVEEKRARERVEQLQALENAEIEARLDNGPRIERDYNPFDSEHMKK